MKFTRKQKILSTSVSTLAVLIVASCSFTKGKQTSERAVARFHEQFNAGQYHDIYAQSDEGFRKVTSEQDAVALFDAIRRKLGTVKNANQN